MVGSGLARGQGTRLVGVPRLASFIITAGITAAPGNRADAGDPNCEGVVNSGAIASFFDAAPTRRVDLVMLGDSNQAYGGHGWDHAWTAALAERFGVYATGLLSAGEGAGNGGSLGATWQGFSTASSGLFDYSGADAALDEYLPGTMPVPPHGYLFLPAGERAGGSMNHGMFVEAGSFLGVNDALRFHLATGVFPAGDPGSFRLAIRLQQSPWTLLAASPTLFTGGPAAGVALSAVDLPAAARNAALGFRFTPWGTDIVGPFIAYWMRVENLSRSAGASAHTLYSAGGQSARDMAAALLAAPDEELRVHFSLVRALQPEPRLVLIRVNTGLNDRNETEPSLGPAGIADADSPEAYADNLTAIIMRIEQVWSSNAWPMEELHFLLSPSHPVSVPDDAELDSYRTAATALALSHPRCAATRFDRLTDAAEMLASGWYQSGGSDRNHLTAPGFQALTARELDAILPPICPGDADGDSDADFSDISLILTRWLQCAPLPGQGDADGDRRINFMDITAVLTHWGPCS